MMFSLLIRFKAIRTLISRIFTIMSFSLKKREFWILCCQNQVIRLFVSEMNGFLKIDWNNRVFEIQDWNEDEVKREKQREELIHEIRTSIYQLPNSF